MARTVNAKLSAWLDGETPSRMPSATPVQVTEESTPLYRGNIPQNTTDQPLGIAIDISELKLLVIFCDQDISLQTNNAGSPVDTLAVKANVPNFWTPDTIFANPFSVDVTQIFATTGAVGADGANLDIFAAVEA